MLAITVRPGIANSAALTEMPEPEPAEGAVLVRALALGVCGTDREILAAEYGAAPPGEEHLILGHESLGEVIEAPRGCGLAPGDIVVGIVRRPDPVPCRACAAGEWDMCRNGRYTERGIKERHGYGAERFRIEPDFAVKVDRGLGLCGVLLEPASVLAKAWDHIDRIGHRGRVFAPRTLLVTGAGPIGLIAALFGRQRGLDVTVYDRNRDGPKPDLVRALGGTYLTGGLDVLETLAPDIVIECTGAVPVIAAVLGRTAPAGIVCLAGVSGTSHASPLDVGLINRTMVLNNGVAFGTVNANRAHFEMAAAALARADKAWLGRLISRRVPLARWQDALAREPDDIKTVVEFGSR
jgi:threonine dehydrogenase-like Zn-dependent dehydrogenase